MNRFRQLTAATIVATFALIVIGGIVRVSESGLGCGPAGSGAEGWPLCTGKVIPLVGGSTLIEFTHRIVAGVVAIMIALLAWLAWRRRELRVRPWLARGSAAAASLVLLQAALGGLTVEHNLHAVLVAIHLGVAMVLLAILLGLYRATMPGVSASATPGFMTASATALLLVLATIVAGGYVAGTEGEGTADKPVAGAHTACGTEFPSCGDSLLPFGRDSLLDAQLSHRLLMFFATISVLFMAGFAHLRGFRHWPVYTAVVLVLLQVLLGAMNVWFGKHAGLIVGHLTLATLLWAVLIWATLTRAEAPGWGSEPARIPQSAVPG